MSESQQTRASAGDTALDHVDTVDFLLVEDNPGDVRLTKKAFERGQIGNNIDVVTDGVEAMEYLRANAGSGGGLPDLILLDLKLPRKDGREVLTEIKNDEDFKRIPVVILTSSDSES